MLNRWCSAARGIPLRLRLFAGLVAATMAACGFALWRGWVDADTLGQLIEGRGPAAMVSYVLAVIASELLWFPRMWGLLAGGLLFGPLGGTVLSLVGDTATAIFCYWTARGSGAAYVDRVINRRPRLRRVVDILTRRRGVLTVFLLRALPMHYTGASYASGLAGTRFSHYLLGTLLGSIPTAVFYTAVGDAARDPSSPLFVAGVVAVVVLSAVGLWLARRVWTMSQDV